MDSAGTWPGARGWSAGGDMAGRAQAGLVLVATVLARQGTVGVQTHVSQVLDLLHRAGRPVRAVDPGAWGWAFGPALLLPGRVLRRARLETGVRLDRYWHRRFLELALGREFRWTRPALVYAQDPRSASAALRVRGGAPVPVVMAVHYNVSQASELVDRGLIRRGSRTDRAIRDFEAAVVAGVDGLVFVSDFMRQQVLDAVPAARHVPSTVIPNFVADAAAPAPPDAPRDCITVGNLLHRKNQAYLLQVLAAAKRNGRHYTLTVVGDGPERARLERLSSRLQLEDQVRFTGARFDVDELLGQHRLYVHSSHMENCPFALIEALRAGLPVVAAPVGGIPEVLGRDGAGRYWDLDDPEAGAELLAGWLDDPAALSTASRLARNRFAENFTADIAGERLLRFLDGPSPPRAGNS